MTVHNFASCSQNMHLRHSHRKETPTNASLEAEGSCKPRCVCQEGHVRLSPATTNDDGSLSAAPCVRPSQCPCHHAGKSYGDGQQITRPDECQTW